MVLLSRLAKQFYRRSDEELLGMQLRHLVALSYVRDHDGCPQQDLADAFCMDANNVVLLLNELEELGYVTRLRDPARPPPPPRRSSPTPGARALDARRARAGSDRGRSPAGARRRASARRCWRLLTRALRGVEPRPTAREPPTLEAAYSATTASIST